MHSVLFRVSCVHVTQIHIMDFSKRALLEFIETSIAKGRLNKNTGGGIRAACRKILEQVPAEEDVRKIDVAAELFQYSNRHPNELSADSLRVYESRVKSVIDSFVKSVTDPTGYKLPGKTSSARPARATTRKAAEREANESTTPEEAGAGSHSSAPSTARSVATEMSLALPFPLRPAFLAQVVVPRDMTKDEAKRLAAFLDALAHDPP